ncbi:MAG: type II secretion system protein [Patescibacteria group bacterium]|jgi:prepilin-type N-terminal cleavage/methylation domain-containing protein
MNKKSSKAFTLIELLVVIAIIGILATVVIANLQSGRAGARAANVLSSARSVTPIAVTCLDGGGTIIQPTSGGAGAQNICTNPTDAPGAWPDISDISDWQYGTAADDVRRPTGIDTVAGDFKAGTAYQPTTFYFNAYRRPVGAAAGVRGDWYVECKSTGCTKTGF